MLSIAVVPVCATAVNTIDNFETGNVGAFTKYSSGYWCYESSSQSGLLVKPTVASWSEHITVSPDKGYNGSQGLYIHSDTSAFSDTGNYRVSTIMTKSISLSADEEAILSYKVKFLELPQNYTRTDDLIYLSCITDKSPTNKTHVLSVNKTCSQFKDLNGKTSNFSVNKWYTIVVKVTGTGTTKSVEAYVLNEDNSLNIATSKDTFTTSESFSFWPVYTVGGLTNEEIHLVVDDVQLTTASSDDTVGIDELFTNVNNGDINVPLNQNFTLSFDHAITSPENGSITLYEKENTSNKVSVTIENKTFNSFTVNPDVILSSNTEYTLNFSNITSKAGKALDSGIGEISFKTINESIKPVTFKSASYGEKLIPLTDGGTGVGIGDDIYLNFDGEISLPSSTDVKVYKTSNNENVDVEFSLSDDKKSLIINPFSLLGLKTEYTINFSGITSSLGGILTGDVNKLSFTTSSQREQILVSDDLESSANGTSIKNHTSDVLEKACNSLVPYIKSGIGYKGSNALNIVKDAHSVSRAYTKSFALDDIETLYFEYKMNFASFSDVNTGNKRSGLISMWIDSTSNSSSIFRIDRRDDGKYYIVSNSGSSPAELLTNYWYTVVICVTKTAQKCYLYGENGALLNEVSNNYPVGSDGSVFIYPAGDDGDSRYDLRLDDFKVYRLSDHKLSLNTSNSTVTNGMNDVIPDKDITLSFNQPLLKESNKSVALYNGTTQIPANISHIGGSEIVISPENILDDGTTYTIKFASTFGALSGNESAVSDISFTIKKIYDLQVKSSTLAITDKTVTAGDVTVWVKNVGTQSASVVPIAVIYDDSRLKKLLGIEIFAEQNISLGENPIVLSFENAYQGVGSVEILMYDNLKNLTPLMHNYKITE